MAAADQQRIDDIKELEEVVKTLTNKRNVARVQKIIDSLKQEVPSGAHVLAHTRMYTFDAEQLTVRVVGSGCRSSCCGQSTKTRTDQ